jgi:hypothetical protein
MKKRGMLLLAQADHLTGEEIGYAVEQIMSRGAENVYVIPGITKKNRTGCLLLIDINPNDGKDWALFLAEEFCVYGYHHIRTTHYRSCCRMKKLSAIIRKDGLFFETEVQAKTRKGNIGVGRVEHADLVRVRGQVKEILKMDISLSKLRAYLETSRLTNPQDRLEIEL